MQPVMSVSEVQGLLEDVFPEAIERYKIREVSSMGALMEKPFNKRDLRPGGTLSGPSMFELADISFYVAALGMIGPKALTVTTSASINFMRKPEAVGMWAEARILKLGRALIVGDVLMYSDALEKPVAHANITYSIPPKG